MMENKEQTYIDRRNTLTVYFFIANICLLFWCFATAIFRSYLCFGLVIFTVVMMIFQYILILVPFEKTWSKIYYRSLIMVTLPFLPIALLFSGMIKHLNK